MQPDAQLLQVYLLSLMNWKRNDWNPCSEHINKPLSVGQWRNGSEIYWQLQEWGGPFIFFWERRILFNSNVYFIVYCMMVFYVDGVG